MASTIFSGNDIKTLKSNIDLNGNAKILSGSTDPTSSATSAPIGSLYLNTTNGNLYKKQDAGSSTNWVKLAAGGDAGINYIANPNAEQNTTGWATYADAAGNIPVDGTGGTATSLTFSRSTSSPLRGTASFSMAQANSTSLQGKGVSYDFTIDSADQAKPLAIQFDFNASSTFVAADGKTAPLNDGTTTTNAGNSDIEVFIYDVTNSTLIYCTPQVITANGANNFTFKSIFQTASNSTSYRLIFHVATTSANATGWTYKFDSVYVGPQSVSYGAPVTDWTAYTPTLNSNTSISVNTAQWRRVGDTVQVQGKITWNGNGANSSLTISTPSGLSIDTAKLGSSSADKQTLGSGLSNLASLEVSAAVWDSGSNVAFYKTGGSNLLNSSAFTNTAEFTYQFFAPISGWSSTVLMSNDTDTRVVAAAYQSSASTAFTSATTIPWATLKFDTHAGMNTSTGVYTVPVSGLYRVSVALYSTSAARTIGDGFTINLRKNGSIYSRLYQYSSPSSSTVVISLIGSDIVNCVAGDTLDIRGSADSTYTLSGTASDNHITIDRISGPAAIAATDTVSFRGTNTASTAISTQATIPFTLSDDSTGGWSTDTFTVPVSGRYTVYARLESGSGNSGTAYIQKNGSTVSFSSALNITGLTKYEIEDTIRCLAGDTLRIQADASGTNTLASTSNRNILNIKRTGNY